jgi:protein TonB
MPIALALALAIHVALIAGVGVRPPEPTGTRSNSLQMMIVTEPGSESASTVPAVTAAQADRAGDAQALLPETPPATPATPADSASAATDRLRPTNAEAGPVPASPAGPEPVTKPAPAAPNRPERTAPEPPPLAMIEARSLAPPTPQPPAAVAPERPSTEDPRPEPAEAIAADPLDRSPSDEQTPKPISAADIFASRNAEMANLASRIRERSSSYANRKRRKAISTATREYIYANYMEGWRRKVERIGNLNYPREARELGLFGSLILHAAVRSDGSIEGIRVVRSSGHEVLDQAAVRIVELAAPFAPFPPNIKRETDVLDITRTWQFQRNHQLGWDN